jgi:WD40 repeat protein
MLTAATDFQIRQWDTMQATCISCLCGHSASVKCLTAHPTCSDIFASGTSAQLQLVLVWGVIVKDQGCAGGKDGSIMLWDLRLPSRDMEHFRFKGAQVRVEVCHRQHHHQRQAQALTRECTCLVCRGRLTLSLQPAPRT